MTQQLEHVIDQIRQLPDDEQDMLAAIVREELADTARWRQRFAETQGPLARLAAQVRADIHGGNTEPLDPADL